MDKTKLIIITVLSFLANMLGVLAIPVGILILCNLIDYITGMIAAKYRSQNINSNQSFHGIWKKVCMWLLIVIGAMIDTLLKYAADYMELGITFTFVVAMVVTVWLIVNEIISVLENINDIGVDLPPFLLPFVKNIKSQVEKKSNAEHEEET